MWVGGFGPRTAAIAARTESGLLHLDPGVLPTLRDAYQQAGRDPDDARLSGTINLVISDDPEAAWARIGPHLAYQWQSYAHYATVDATRSGTSAIDADGVDPETLRSAGPVMTPPHFDVVTPEEAIRRLDAWLGPLPVEHVYFWESIAGMPEDLVRRHVELIASEVAPALRRLSPPAARLTSSSS
jgi:alkanesulfonate monooxygenase SsuD/methylene tetrahydromethanopterin reductase-like flavin-dependent oxidoreductase (luciferase family)